MDPIAAYDLWTAGQSVPTGVAGLGKSVGWFAGTLVPGTVDPLTLLSGDIYSLGDLTAGSKVAASLNWLRHWGDSLTNLDLELYEWDDNATRLVDRSASLIDNTEFLTLDVESPGFYFLRVFSDSLQPNESEQYALAWQSFIDPRGLGDFNDDGIVDGQDLLTWQISVGVTGVNSPADADGDDDVDSDDLAIWESHFGEPVPATSLAVNVPEPATLVLLMSVAAGGFLRRRWAAKRAEKSSTRNSAVYPPFGRGRLVTIRSSPAITPDALARHPETRRCP